MILHPTTTVPSLVPRPSPTCSFFRGRGKKPMGKARKQTLHDVCHCFCHYKGSVTTRVLSLQGFMGSGVLMTFIMWHSPRTLAALCSRNTRYSIVGEPDGS